MTKYPSSEITARHRGLVGAGCVASNRSGKPVYVGHKLVLKFGLEYPQTYGILADRQKAMVGK